MNKLLTLSLLLLIIISCSEKDDTIKTKNITFDIISEEASITSLEISDFNLLTTSIKSVNGTNYYEISYSFDIHNMGTETLELTDFLLQAHLEKGADNQGAGGRLVPDFSIEPGGTQKIEYSFNSAKLPDPLDMDGYTLFVNVYYGDSELLFSLQYLLHAM